jgi:hypothetical protein
MWFCGLARVVGVEAVLRPVTEGDGGVGRDLAQCTLHVMRGENDEAPVTAVGMLGRQWDYATLFDLILLRALTC